MNELKSIDNKSNKGEILEYRLKRLLFHMGNYSHTNIVLKTNSPEENIHITDLDVYGINFENDFSYSTVWADCKSGKADVLKHIIWIKGIKTNEHIDNVIFVKNNVRFSAKEYALSLGIKVLGDDIIELLEKRYNIDKDEWIGSYDYNFIKKQQKTFSNITIPQNRGYKNIFEFFSCKYWSIEPYSQVKKIIFVIKELNGYFKLPLNSDEELSIKWMISSLISLLLLSLFKICGQTFYYNDIDKKGIITSKLNDGGVSSEKQKEIRNAAIKMAESIINQYVQDYNTSELEKLIERPPYPYSNQIIDFIIRISNNPFMWKECLRWLDYYFIEYELKQEEKGFNEFKKNNSDFFVCTKSLLHLLFDLTGLPKEMFPKIWSNN